MPDALRNSLRKKTGDCANTKKLYKALDYPRSIRATMNF